MPSITIGETRFDCQADEAVPDALLNKEYPNTPWLSSRGLPILFNAQS